MTDWKERAEKAEQERDIEKTGRLRLYDLYHAADERARQAEAALALAQGLLEEVSHRGRLMSHEWVDKVAAFLAARPAPAECTCYPGTAGHATDCPAAGGEGR